MKAAAAAFASGVRGDVAERAEHEPEAVALVPVLLEHPLALLGGDAHRLDAALLEAEGDDGVADLVPDRVEVLLRPVDLGLVHRAVARGHHVLRRALEDGEVRRPSARRRR